ncbi:MAG: N-6 DNA methylase [Deltaproteobacteria bacterium]|nr:N-6 DNA methylase [Deltaproteobacteria bacterium]
MLKAYLKKISEITIRGDAREESYYSALEELLVSYANQSGRKNTVVTTLPKTTEAGNPDFRVWDGSQHITGYVEAKRPTETNLDNIEAGEQVKRYIHTFPNVILTNFLEFRLYRDGERVAEALIARPVILHKLKTPPPLEKEREFTELLDRFFSFSLPKTYSAKTLAVELAKRTRFLKDIIRDELKADSADKGQLRGFFELFKTHLIHNLAEDDFSDLYAQTVTYGLFAARTRSQNGFTRQQAFDNIPHTIGILRDVFRFISLGDAPKQMECLIDDISEVLAVADVSRLLHDYFHEGKGGDPIIHFYETFLAEYDPKERERRGVYYTPEPVVSYITRSLNAILKDYFNRRDGFAASSVTALDPAAGTLTFLAEASKIAVSEFVEKYGEGGKSGLIKDHILKNFHAFELMMAPYAVGHLKMSFLLEELGYRLKDDDRFKLCLTNTLEMEELAQSKLPGMSSLAEESRLAGKVKKETPILVILGNPPYSGHSVNVYDEVKAYYKVDGKPLGEKNPKWLQDDYVKFIRFAQWKIDLAGEGVLGFITNHSYLDNPTFRGMRRSLMESFDHIFLLDLHGNALKKERCPDGSKDENVFDIMQGVAVALFIKKKGLKKKLHHAELWGTRDDKYGYLLKKDFKTTRWKTLDPKSDLYLFVPRDERSLKVYDRFMKITEIFPVNGVGVVTARDGFVIDFDKGALKNRIMMFRNERLPDEIINQTFGLKDNGYWKTPEKRRGIIADDRWEDSITKILYRPFDVRWIFYHDDVVERPRREVMRHMTQGENLGLITRRQMLSSQPCNYFFVSEYIICDGVIRSDNKGGESLFPLYLYEEGNPSAGPASKNGARRDFKKDKRAAIMALFEDTAGYCAKKPNIAPLLMEGLSKAYKKTPSPEDIFNYIYAVLYSNAYREKYKEFLKTDFPRVPFVKSYKTFKVVGEKGRELVELHLLKSPDLEKPYARFQGKGDNRVEKHKYDAKEKRIYINADQYFEGVEEDVWAYMVGGYQALDKWLKERKGRPLSHEDIRLYCRIAASLKKTIRIQKELEKLYPRIEEDLCEF